MLLTAEVNLTNIFTQAFLHADPKSAKRQSSHQCHFVLLESTQAKAAHMTMMKLARGLFKSNCD